MLPLLIKAFFNGLFIPSCAAKSTPQDPGGSLTMKTASSWELGIFLIAGESLVGQRCLRTHAGEEERGNSPLENCVWSSPWKCNRKHSSAKAWRGVFLLGRTETRGWGLAWPPVKSRRLPQRVADFVYLFIHSCCFSITDCFCEP